MNRESIRSGACLALGLLFVLAGINHFRVPGIYVAMIPPGLPRSGMLNVIAGGAEILGGAGVLIPGTKRAAAWGLIALLIAVFPANVHVALHGWPGANLPAWLLWARLPFQAFFIAWVYLSCLREPPPESHLFS